MKKNYGEEELLLWILLRTDLGMSRGKICSQTSHAVLGVYKELSNPQDLPDDHEEDAGDPVLMAQWASLEYPK